MTTSEKQRVLAELRGVPGIGPRISSDLWELGIRSVNGLKGKDPETLYRRRCRQVGAPLDRCLLYVFRGAVYFASRKKHDPNLLRWWSWSDANLLRRRSKTRQ